MVTNPKLFFLHRDAKNELWSQNRFLAKVFWLFGFWTFFLSIFENGKTLLTFFFKFLEYILTNWLKAAGLIFGTHTVRFSLHSVLEEGNKRYNASS